MLIGGRNPAAGMCTGIRGGRIVVVEKKGSYNNCRGVGFGGVGRGVASNMRGKREKPKKAQFDSRIINLCLPLIMFI